MMKETPVILLLAFLASPAFAQDDAAAARTAAGCGSAQVAFNVKTDKKQHPVGQPEAGKALVYIFQHERRDADVSYIGSPTTRVGVDGNWVGANRGSSYFFFSVDPGDHNLCANLQWILKRFSKVGSAANFSAEAERVYYFRVTIEERIKREAALYLEPIDSAEGQFLVSSSSLSTSRPKK
jgi:hypothetical protein